MADTFITGAADAAMAIERLIDQVSSATRRAVEDGAALIERQAKQNSSGRPGPNVQSGAHRRGIIVEGPKSEGQDWVARIGPTMVYSRRLELGGGNWKSGVKFPYMEPAVMQVGPKLEPLFEQAWARAVRSAG